MVRRFSVDSPADLAALEGYVRSGTLGNLARVWSVARKQGKTAFDGLVFAVFSTEKRGCREAEIIRLGLDGELHHVAALKYNLALDWCAKHLRPVWP